MPRLPLFLRRLRAYVGGSRNSYSDHFNTPVKFSGEDWFVNERIVEVPFVLNRIDLDGAGKRLLEFGCTRSPLALHLASLGYDVVGIDLRPYPFHHPRLQTICGNVLDYEDDIGFDYVTAVSSLEHVGLGAYSDDVSGSALSRVARRLAGLLKEEGGLIVTVPFGQPHQDEFLRSFDYDFLASLFLECGLRISDERFFHRLRGGIWQPCTVDEAALVSNAKPDRPPSGVNGVGCFLCERTVAGSSPDPLVSV